MPGYHTDDAILHSCWCKVGESCHSTNRPVCCGMNTKKCYYGGGEGGAQWLICGGGGLRFCLCIFQLRHYMVSWVTRRAPCTPLVYPFARAWLRHWYPMHCQYSTLETNSTFHEHVFCFPRTLTDATHLGYKITFIV